MNYRLDIEYDGSRYEGWQRQNRTTNTIQGKIEEVLSKMCETPIEIDGAGRTDAGVHAKGQVANVHLETEKSCEEICEYLNHYLPEDIAVQCVSEAEPRFHSRLLAKEKIYQYRILTGGHKNVFERKYVYPLQETLDIKAMKKAAEKLVGTHDFKSFCSIRTQVEDTVRRIYSITIKKNEDDRIDIRISGNGFLYNMVRAMTGTVVYAAEGKIRPQDIGRILESGNRTAAGPTVPPGGLYMTHLWYDDGEVTFDA